MSCNDAALRLWRAIDIFHTWVDCTLFRTCTANVCMFRGCGGRGLMLLQCQEDGTAYVRPIEQAGEEEAYGLW